MSSLTLTSPGSPATSAALPTTQLHQRSSRAQRQAQPWHVEARGCGLVLRLEEGLDLDPAALARLTRDIQDVRAAGFAVALACAPGKALEALRAIRFHRFVDVLPTRDAAWRWLASSRQTLKAVA